MNHWDLLILLALAAVVFLARRAGRRSAAKDCSGCCQGCSGCRKEANRC